MAGLDFCRRVVSVRKERNDGLTDGASVVAIVIFLICLIICLLDETNVILLIRTDNKVKWVCKQDKQIHQAKIFHFFDILCRLSLSVHVWIEGE